MCVYSCMYAGVCARARVCVCNIHPMYVVYVYETLHYICIYTCIPWLPSFIAEAPAQVIVIQHTNTHTGHLCKHTHMQWCRASGMIHNGWKRVIRQVEAPLQGPLCSTRASQERHLRLQQTGTVLCPGRHHQHPPRTWHTFQYVSPHVIQVDINTTYMHAHTHVCMYACVCVCVCACVCVYIYMYMYTRLYIAGTYTHIPSRPSFIAASTGTSHCYVLDKCICVCMFIYIHIRDISLNM